jgi:hypothetical protein
MKINVKDITFTEYMNLKDKSEYDCYLEYLKAEDIFCIGNFTDLSFGFVKDMQEYVNCNELTWNVYFKELHNLKNISAKKLGSMSFFKIYKSLLYIIEQISSINKLESENLGHNPSSEEMQAGIEVFNKYKAFIQFDTLTRGDITKIEAIRKIEYNVCFTKLMYDADKNQFDINLFNIKNKL